jgi:hypothetical protein
MEQFWLYLRACHALEVDKDRLGAALDDIRPPSAASWPQRNKDHGAQSSNVAPGPVVAGALRRHVLLLVSSLQSRTSTRNGGWSSSS